MANNQYVNKVIFGDETLIDLTSDTVNPGVLLAGYTAHNHSGAAITGTVATGVPSIGFVDGTFKVQLAAGVYGETLSFSNIYVTVPSSGTNSITINLPNGTTTPDTSTQNDWIPVTLTVDTLGNSELTADTISATKLTATLISGDDYNLASEV